MTYFTPMYGNFRTYINGTFCDNGNGIESTPRYNEGIYFEQGNSLWINLYIPSELTWDTTGLTLQQQGNAAAGEQVTITMTKGGTATQATLYLRIPSWVSGTPTLAVNGSAQTQSLSAGTYVSLNRQWKVGDVITLTLPAGLRLEHAKDVTSMVSVFFGPILLAGELGSANMPNDFADKDAYLSTAPADRFHHHQRLHESGRLAPGGCRYAVGVQGSRRWGGFRDHLPAALRRAPRTLLRVLAPGCEIAAGRGRRELLDRADRLLAAKRGGEHRLGNFVPHHQPTRTGPKHTHRRIDGIGWQRPDAVALGIVEFDQHHQLRLGPSFDQGQAPTVSRPRRIALDTGNASPRVDLLPVGTEPFPPGAAPPTQAT